MKRKQAMPIVDKNVGMRTEFSGDEALQQIHLARKALVTAARPKRVTFGAYVRSQKLRSKNSTRI